MAYAFMGLSSLAGEPASVIRRVVSRVPDATVTSMQLGHAPHRWAAAEVQSCAVQDPVLLEVHVNGDTSFPREIAELERLPAAPELTWVESVWTFTLSGASDPAVAIAVAEELAVQARTLFFDDVSGFELTLR